MAPGRGVWLRGVEFGAGGWSLAPGGMEFGASSTKRGGPAQCAVFQRAAARSVRPAKRALRFDIRGALADLARERGPAGSGVFDAVVSKTPKTSCTETEHVELADFALR